MNLSLGFTLGYCVRPPTRALRFYNVKLEGRMRSVAAIVLYLISVIVIAVLVASFLNYGRYGF
jgi:hypothetical protein